MTDFFSSGLAPFSELRERQGMSVGDVSARTRMSAKQIDALDRGDFASLPGVAFSKGAIRSYCKVLGIEPQPYLEAYAEANPGTQSPGSDVYVANLATTMPQRGDGGPSDSGSSKRWLILGVSLMMVAILFFFANPSGTRVEPAKSPSSAPDLISGSGPRITPPVSAASAPLIETNPKPTDPAVASPPAPNLPEAKPERQTALAKTGLIFELSRDAWIEVRDSQGKVLASRLFKKGDDTKVDVTPPFSMVVGSASGVVATLNGKAIDLKSNIKDDVARVTVSAQ